MIANWMRRPRFSGLTVLYLVTSVAMWAIYGPRVGVAVFTALGLVTVYLHYPPSES